MMRSMASALPQYVAAPEHQRTECEAEAPCEVSRVVLQHCLPGACIMDAIRCSCLLQCCAALCVRGQVNSNPHHC